MKINSAILFENHIKEELQQKWEQWKRQQSLCPDVNTWWVRYCKKRIRIMFQCEEAERRRDHRKLENLYYECLYDIVRNADTNGANLPALNRIKAKIVKLHSQRLKSVLQDNVVADIFEEEQPTFYHLTQMQKRRTA